MQAAFKQLVARIPGIEHICVSNPYGLPVIRYSVEDATLDCSAVETASATVFAMTAEAFDKLPQHSGASSGAASTSLVLPAASGPALGKSRSIVRFSDTSVIVQASLNPLILAIVALPHVNVGMLMEVLPQLQAVLEPVRKLAEDAAGGGS